MVSVNIKTTAAVVGREDKATTLEESPVTNSKEELDLKDLTEQPNSDVPVLGNGKTDEPTTQRSVKQKTETLPLQRTGPSGR